MTKTGYQKLIEDMEEAIVKIQKLSQSETTVLRNSVKRGVYKELYTQNLLTEQQLNGLLAQIK